MTIRSGHDQPISDTGEQSGHRSDSVATDALRYVAHDLRQPVAAIRALAAAAADAQAGEPVRRRLQQICDQADWLSAIIDDALLRDDVRARRDRRPVHVRTVVRAAVEAEQLTYPGRITIDDEDADYRCVVTSAARLRRAVANVLANAITAAGPVGSVHVAVHARRSAEIVEIIDDGPGLGHSAQGHGLGLQIARDALADCGGRLEMERRPDGRTVVRLVLPVTPTTTQAGARCE